MFCERNNLALRVLYKNAVIYKSHSERHDQPVIVYHIWGDHAFFYRPRMSMPALRT